MIFKELAGTSLTNRIIHQPRTLEAERYLGILPDIEKVAISGWDVRVYDDKDPYRVARTRLMAESVEPTVAFPIVSRYILNPFRYVLIIPFHIQSVPFLVPQYLHEFIYHKHVEAMGGKIDKGVSLVGLAQDVEGVTVELAQIIDGVSHIVKEKYDWVVGSDGAHSELHAFHS